MPVDAAYWMVVSPAGKAKTCPKLCEPPRVTFARCASDADQGVATRSDVLSVDVKLNAAQVDMVKVDNGLVLARMALAQVCGLPVHAQFTLLTRTSTPLCPNSGIAPEGGLRHGAGIQQPSRPACTRARHRGSEAAEACCLVDHAAYSGAFIGSYEFSNPNMYDGFKKKFKGAFSVGAMISIPLWHWGGDYNNTAPPRATK